MLVDLPLHPGKRHPVVRSDQDERVVELAGLFQCARDAAKLPVEPLDLDRVVEHIVADHLRIRVIRRKRDGLRVLARLRRPAPSS